MNTNSKTLCLNTISLKLMRYVRLMKVTRPFVLEMLLLDGIYWLLLLASRIHHFPLGCGICRYCRAVVRCAGFSIFKILSANVEEFYSSSLLSYLFRFYRNLLDRSDFSMFMSWVHISGVIVGTRFIILLLSVVPVWLVDEESGTGVRLELWTWAVNFLFLVNLKSDGNPWSL